MVKERSKLISHDWVNLYFQIVGLGNFDRQTTRHSVGMQVVDRLAVCLHTCFHREKNCSGCIATATLNGVDIILLKPKMPMNVNGTSVRKTGMYRYCISRFFKHGILILILNP